MANTDDKSPPPLRPATRLTHAGRDKRITGQFVNPPVFHASTVLFDTVDDMEHLRPRYSYGRLGTPTSEALEAIVAELEGADGVAVSPSGLAAATTALLSCLSAGDHLLLVDGIYAPIRRLADSLLKRLGILTTYFNPAIGTGIAALFTEKTRAVYLEAPASLTFEMQDIDVIVAVAKQHGALVLFDNTWATPLHFRALDHGIDLSIISGTKYFVGHSDAVVGTVAARGDAWPKLRQTHVAMGLHVAPDDMYLTLRGIRTMGVRLAQHEKAAMTIATWLAARPEVARVLYPALPSDPGHALWKKYMTGASGLFGVVFNGWSNEQAKLFIDGLKLFGIGASWGGFESLATLSHPIRTATKWKPEGATIRLHIGLEDPADLMADLEKGFARVAENL